MVALIPLCSLVYGAIFLHEKATWRQVVFSVLSVAGVIVLAVYATGIGAGSFEGCENLFVVDEFFRVRGGGIIGRGSSGHGLFVPIVRNRFFIIEEYNTNA